jgi:hypothetical protein
MTTLFALVFVLSGNAMASDDKPTIAVFTKNTTNPAYQAFRIAAGSGVRPAPKSCTSFQSSRGSCRWSSGPARNGANSSGRQHRNSGRRNDGSRFG